MTLVAWLVTLPRTAAVAHEAGLARLVPAAAGPFGKAAFLILYFALSLFFAIDRSSVIDKIGKYLTPALLILLILLVGRAIWSATGRTSVSNAPEPG